MTMPDSTPLPYASPSDAAGVVSKAVVRAADRLDLGAVALARVLGLSPATVYRLRKGQFALEWASKPFELALLLIRLYRSLDAIAGGDRTVARRWLKAENTALGARPADLVTSVAGLVNVIAYLDARRAVL
ncbi:MAG: MbcA/ParS/Xre antitoxin family protein [Azospirillaceae bacterium]